MSPWLEASLPFVVMSMLILGRGLHSSTSHLIGGFEHVLQWGNNDA